MRIAKKTMLMAPSSIGTATRRRRRTYWNTAQLIRLGQNQPDAEGERTQMRI